MVQLYAERGIDDRLPSASLPMILWRADRLLRRYEFLKPFRDVMEGRRGRPTIPMECFLRLMFLKSHYGWGYERLVAEVDSTPHLRRFTRIAVNERLPHSTTLLKLARRFGRSRLDSLLDKVANRLGLIAEGN